MFILIKRKLPSFITIVVTVFYSAYLFSQQAQMIYLGKFSQGDISGWESKQFDGETQYKLINDTSTGTQVLQAQSNNSASGLFKEQKIDLQKTPYLNWSWKTEQIYNNINESDKQGDDFVARIYIVIDGGVFFWKTRALNYVWSSNNDKYRSWPNPYTSNATMFAVESSEKNIGKWLSYKRNVYQDLKQLIGKEIRYIDALAIMTDSDNSGQSATTYYGDIYFSNH